MPHNERTLSAANIERPAQTLRTEGLFWLEPSVLQEVDHLINATHLSTMSLGVETRSSELPTARAELLSILVGQDEPLKDELKRAVDVGFMYGSLIAKTSHDNPNSSPDDQALPAPLGADLRAAFSGLDLDDSHDNSLFFMRLRGIEVKHAHSDILAFSLAATQDHMGREFGTNHKSGGDMTRQQMQRMQSTFYAGALAGALLTGGLDPDKPTVEIMRSLQGGEEAVSIRLEFEPGDSLDEALDLALSSKLHFRMANRAHGEPYIAVLPNGLQFGPNALSLPLFIEGMEEPDLIVKVPLGEVEALVVAKTDPESQTLSTLRLISDPVEYLEQPEPSDKIVGLVLENICVSSYDARHPNARTIREMAAKLRGVPYEELSYSSGIEKAYGPPRRRLGAMTLSGLAGTGGIWLPDALQAAFAEGRVHWGDDVLMQGLLLAALGVIAAGKHILRRSSVKADEHYQNALDQITQYR